MSNTGPQGERGERGETGDQGEQGRRGAPGRDAPPLTDEQIREIGAATMEMGAKLSAFSHASGQLTELSDRIGQLSTAVSELRSVMATKEEVHLVKTEIEGRNRRRLVGVLLALGVLALIVVGNVWTIHAIREAAHDESCAQREDTRAVIAAIAPQTAERLPSVEGCG